MCLMIYTIDSIHGEAQKRYLMQEEIKAAATQTSLLSELFEVKHTFKYYPSKYQNLNKH